MATELGQAYVQIMPSAKGISGSIQKVINPEATAAGKSAGSRIASSIADSMNKAGKTLTKAITVPALGAAAAAGGIVSALGWGRLTGLDSARAKLQGLGYDAESVERISGQVRDSIQGTVTTMAEGVSVAAGGLAAGVKEGAELERYIKLVGDAAVGANRPVNDMAMIFNRVQGMGRLMTQELNMIEDGMPGFAMAMSNSLGVTQAEFREMVTAGEVSSDQFLDVMDSFAGQMSDAYANSWAGMVANTKSNIGIIGESLLGGVFEQSKESIAEFLEYLRSDDVRAWAAQAGQSIGAAFQRIVESVKNAIQWWINLDGNTKKLIMTIAGIAIAIGPVLMIVGKLITTAIAIHGWFGKLKVAAGILKTAIAGISAPVLIVIGVIAGLIALFVHLYKSNEGFRDLVQTVWTTIKETIMTVVQAVSDFVMGIFGGLVAWWNENNEQIFTKVQEIWSMIWSVINTVVSEIVSFVMEIWSLLVAFWQEHGQMILDAAMNIWNTIWTVISTVATTIWNIIQTLADIILNIWNFLWPTVSAILETVWNVIKGVIQGAIDVILGIIQFFAALFTGNWSGMWDAVKNILSGALNIVKSVVKGAFNIIKSIISTVLNVIKNVVSSVWNGIKNTISSIVGSIKDTISNIFNSLKNIVSNAFNNVKDAVKNGITSAFDTVTGFFSKFKDAGKNIITSIADGIKGAISKVTDAIGNVTQKIRDFLPFSPPKIGPLTDIMDVKWGETIAGGIEKGESAVAKAMDDILAFDLTKKATFNDVRQNSDSNPHITQQNQPIILQVDGKTFAQIMGDYTSQEGGNRIRRIERGLA